MSIYNIKPLEWKKEQGAGYWKIYKSKQYTIWKSKECKFWYWQFTKFGDVNKCKTKNEAICECDRHWAEIIVPWIEEETVQSMIEKMNEMSSNDRFWIMDRFCRECGGERPCFHCPD